MAVFILDIQANYYAEVCFMRWMLLYYIVINIVTFILYGIDKMKAIKGQWRIPEKTLMGIAILGGSVGAFSAMYFFHHKTKHWQFKIGIPFFVFIHFLVNIYLLNKVLR